MFSDCQVNKYNLDLEENKGIEADLIIFPSFSLLEDNYYAESAFCQRDSQYLRNYFVSQYYSEIYSPKDRPIAGFIKVNTNNDINKRNSAIFFTNVFMHEIGHILGFTLDVYEPFLIERTIKFPIEYILLLL